MNTIRYEVDGGIATITLNRPDALNALSPFMITELGDAYADAENDERAEPMSCPRSPWCAGPSVDGAVERSIGTSSVRDERCEADIRQAH